MSLHIIDTAQRWANTDFYLFFLWIILGAAAVLIAMPWMFRLPPDDKQ